MSETAFGKWHPIETAPKDYDWWPDLPGEEDEGVGYAIAADGDQMAFLLWFASKTPGYSKPTHWMPLPPPPSPTTQPEE